MTTTNLSNRFTGELDLEENVALLRVLLSAQQPFLPVVARCCALIKFFLIGLDLAYLAAGGIVLPLARLRPSGE